MLFTCFLHGGSQLDFFAIQNHMPDGGAGSGAGSSYKEMGPPMSIINEEKEAKTCLEATAMEIFH